MRLSRQILSLQFLRGVGRCNSRQGADIQKPIVSGSTNSFVIDCFANLISSANELGGKRFGLGSRFMPEICQHTTSWLGAEDRRLLS